MHFPSFLQRFAAKNELSQSSLHDARFPLLSLRDIFPRPGEVFPLRGSFIRADRKIPKSAPFGGAGCDHREQTERVVAVGDWGSSPPATQKTSAGADVFVWCIIFYNFPHCLPVKKRRVVVARNTLPARSTVVGNSGWEGLQG